MHQKTHHEREEYSHALLMKLQEPVLGLPAPGLAASVQEAEVAGTSVQHRLLNPEQYFLPKAYGPNRFQGHRFK